LQLELIDAACAVVDAHLDQGGDRAVDVAGELRAELFPEAPPYVQGRWHRHELRRRLLRRANPLWWLRRLAAGRARLVHVALRQTGAGSVEQLKIMLGGKEVGRVKYQLCHECRRGRIGKISVNPSMQDRGLGTQAIRHLRAQTPGYTWCTTNQYETARSYWVRVARLTGDTYTDEPAAACHHITTAIGAADLEREARP